VLPFFAPVARFENLHFILHRLRELCIRLEGICVGRSHRDVCTDVL
jgi:hypothetical protein